MGDLLILWLIAGVYCTSVLGFRWVDRRRQRRHDEMVEFQARLDEDVERMALDAVALGILEFRDVDPDGHFRFQPVNREAS